LPLLKFQPSYIATEVEGEGVILIEPNSLHSYRKKPVAE